MDMNVKRTITIRFNDHRNRSKSGTIHFYALKQNVAELLTDETLGQKVSISEALQLLQGFKLPNEIGQQTVLDLDDLSYNMLLKLFHYLKTGQIMQDPVLKKRKLSVVDAAESEVEVPVTVTTTRSGRKSVYRPPKD